MSEEFKPGYYWVKLKIFENDPTDRWMVARYYGDRYWDVFGMDHNYEPDDFVEIGPRITPPAN